LSNSDDCGPFRFARAAFLARAGRFGWRKTGM